MNEIQKKIESELRRPNAGNNALCNQLADIVSSVNANTQGMSRYSLGDFINDIYEEIFKNDPNFDENTEPDITEYLRGRKIPLLNYQMSPDIYYNSDSTGGNINMIIPPSIKDKLLISLDVYSEGGMIADMINSISSMSGGIIEPYDEEPGYSYIYKVDLSSLMPLPEFMTFVALLPKYPEVGDDLKGIKLSMFVAGTIVGGFYEAFDAKVLAVASSNSGYCIYPEDPNNISKLDYSVVHGGLLDIYVSNCDSSDLPEYKYKYTVLGNISTNTLYSNDKIEELSYFNGDSDNEAGLYAIKDEEVIPIVVAGSFDVIDDDGRAHEYVVNISKMSDQTINLRSNVKLNWSDGKAPSLDKLNTEIHYREGVAWYH